MRDAIGQEIKVGDKVAYTGGKYANPTVFDVLKLTAKKVTVMVSRGWGPEKVSLWPGHLIVVTDNIRVCLGEAEVVDKDTMEDLRQDSRTLANWVYRGSQ